MIDQTTTSAPNFVPGFGEFLDRIWVWPAGVPRDCTDVRNGLPCSDRDALVLCDSCKAFELACRDYSAEMEEAAVSHQPSAIS